MDLKNKVILVCVAIIVVSFFLPWVSVESEAVGGISKLLTGKKQSSVGAISGFQVPIMANGEESRFMISVIKIFNPDITHADKKSILICLVPLLSIGLYFLSNRFGKNKLVILGIGILGVTIFGGAVFKIFTTDLDKMVIKVSIAIGLWLTLFGYLFIGLIHLKEFFELGKK